MKYQIEKVNIPQEKREEINSKILYLIDNNLCNQNHISKADIANSYTGIGGLHGLKFDDYKNYHDYSEAKKEIENGQFFTPYEITNFIIECLKPSRQDIIMDLTCGHGAFINSMPVESNFYGCELEIKSYKIAKYLYAEANITHGDIRTYDPNIRADIVVGNPPFNLKWKVGNNEYLSQLYYTIKAANHTKPGGIMALVVPCSFLSDDFSDRGMIEEVSKNWNLICQFDISKDTFKNIGVANFPTKIMFFQRKSEYLKEVVFSTEKIQIDDISETSAEKIYNNYILPVINEKEKIKNKLFFENLHCKSDAEQKEFEYQVKKLLYDIKRNPKTSVKTAKCEEYIYKYQHQKQPEGMKYEEWQKKRITPNKVISYLKKVLASQNKVEKDIIRLVKTNDCIKLKAYSRKTKLQLNKMTNITSDNINNMVLNDTYLFHEPTYKKLIDRKVKEYRMQSTPFSQMEENDEVKMFLDNLIIYDNVNDETIKLTERQKHDTNLLLQKRYGFLQWEQGSGKTLSGIAQMMYRFYKKEIKNAFVVSTAISINNNWDVVLKSYGIDYVRITKLADIYNIKDGQIIIVTDKLLCKYQKQIKKFVKIKSQKIMLVFDESDCITNPSSKRTKGILNCFRKAKYKICMTGTSTRNNICEIYPQLELLYNNSINMLCESAEKYVISKDDFNKGELVAETNDMYMLPFQPYKRGYKLFSECHLPDKITVFGVAQKTQDIYNSEVLKRILDKTIITRSFEEISGKNLYEIKQITCKFSPEEKEIYKTAIDEFYKLDYLFKKTGNSRKDSMLKILNQLLLLLKICAAPQTIKEYRGDRLTNKFKKVMCLIDKYDEKIVIGVRHVQNVYAYKEVIQERFPNRPIFIVTGAETTLNQRKRIIEQLKETTNGILICTQQALSCSMNIDFVNKCIIPELHWNNSSMSQFYFRFIRFTSTEWKQVYFVTYENSIESNLLKMILSKEKLNLFMKDEDVDDYELYEKFGIDFDIVNMLMTKEKDKDGKVLIRWGDQEIS